MGHLAREWSVPYVIVAEVWQGNTMEVLFWPNASCWISVVQKSLGDLAVDS